MARHFLYCIISFSMRMGYLSQMRFTKNARATSPRLILRIAYALSRLPLDSNLDDARARAADVWEAGLSALMQNPDFSHFASPAPR